MIKRWPYVLIILGWLLTACGQESEEITPTPFDAEATSIALLASGPPAPITLAELADSPELFENQYIQVIGQYGPRPLLVCNDEAHPSPATWTLSETVETSVPVGGFSDQVRSLIPKGTTMTVNGYWRHWEGPVGCGKQAIGTQMWYLKVTDLVSPEHLAQITMLPVATQEPDQPELPEESTQLPPGETVPAVPITSTVPFTNTPPVVTNTPQPGLPVASPTPGINPASPTAVVTPTNPSATVTQTNTPGTGGTPSPQSTAVSTASGTPTQPGNTSTPGAASPTSSSLGNYTEVNVDPINPDSNIPFGVEYLGAWQKQNWTLELISSDAVTISVVGEPTMNLVLAVYDEVDNEIANQNSVPAGQMEEIRSLSVDPDNIYIVQVFETNGVPGNYFISIAGNGTEDIYSSRGFLNYGDTKQDSLPEGDVHFWYFYGQGGDVIDVVTTADMDALLLISLFNTEGDVLEDEFGDPIEYVEEAVYGLTLPETGLYLIWLEEFAYDPANYTISLSKQ